MKAKEVLVCRSVFLKPPISFGSESLIILGVPYIKVTEIKIAHVLISQLATKVLRPDKINF